MISSLLKEQECATQTLCYLMVSPRTSSLQLNSLEVVTNEDKFGQITRTNRCGAPIFLWRPLLISLLHKLQPLTIVSTDLLVSQEWTFAAYNKFEK